MRNALIAVILIGFTNGAYAGPRECESAIQTYNSTVSDVSNSLRRYANCLSASQGSDDCSIEFRRLRSNQSDFESAVSDYERDCRRS